MKYKINRGGHPPSPSKSENLKIERESLANAKKIPFGNVTRVWTENTPITRFGIRVWPKREK